MISRAKISGGRWTRRVTWEKDGLWRTDMFKNVLCDERLKEAEFICVDGPCIIISAEELRAVLPKLKDRYDNQIWGPFNIDPVSSTINGYKLKMTVQKVRTQDFKQ